jgi:hypothetical protein
MIVVAWEKYEVHQEDEEQVCVQDTTPPDKVSVVPEQPAVETVVPDTDGGAVIVETSLVVKVELLVELDAITW